jgi:hypothetical protein
MVYLGTGEVARQRGISEAVLQATLRRHPALKPPIVNGRRVWAPEHVEALDRHLAAGDRRRKSRTPSPATTPEAPAA